MEQLASSSVHTMWSCWLAECVVSLVGNEWCREADAYIGRFLELEVQIK